MKYAFDEAAIRARDEQWKQDPRAIHLEQPYEAIPVSVDLVPDRPVKLGESRFLKLQVGAPYGKPLRWMNESKDFLFSLPKILAHLREAERPRFEQLSRPPKQHPDAMSYQDYFLFSDRVVDVIRKMDPSAIETREADLVYLKGERAPSCQLVLFTRQLLAEDYSRSLVRVNLDKGKKSLEWLVPRALHEDIEPEVQAFTLPYSPGSVYVSRTLAAALAAISPWKVRFLDPAGHYDIVRFDGLDSDWED